MQSKVAPYAATPDPTHGRSASGAASAAAVASGAPSPVAEADVRLVIEEDEARGIYVYTVLNRRTGEVLQRLPRDRVERLGEDAGYRAGGVIRTKV